MDDLWTRIGVIAGALLVASMVVAVRRKAALTAPRRLETTGLRPGIYLFTSAACDECQTARAKLEEHVGERGYAEIDWEHSPEVFTGLGIEVVPATMMVAADGSALLWRGQPDPEVLGP